MTHNRPPRDSVTNSVETAPRALSRITPEDNVLLGGRAICAYLNCAFVTFVRWVENFGLPAIKRPDGQWMTTITAIDSWIAMAAAIAAENGQRSSLVKYVAERRPSADSTSAQERAAVSTGLVPRGAFNGSGPKPVIGSSYESSERMRSLIGAKPVRRSPASSRNDEENSND